MKKNIFTLFAAALLLCACGTSKKVATDTVTTTTPVTTKPVKSDINRFVTDLDISISLGQEQFNLDGRLFARRDDVLRINLTYMGFIEVATIEFTPDYMLFINRVGKQYTKAGYKDLDVFVKNNITFSTMQDQVWTRFDATKGKDFDSKALSQSLENLFNSKNKNGKKADINIKVGTPDTKRDFSSRTELKSSYKEIPADVLLSSLTGLMK